MWTRPFTATASRRSSSATPKGGKTQEVQANVSAPVRARLVRRGKYALLYLAAKGGELTFSGAAVRLSFDGPAYVGLGVCAHNNDVTETAAFTNVELTTSLPAGKPVLYSTLETQVMTSTDRRVVFTTPARIEAPNWLRDGRTLVYNGGGRLYRVPAAGGPPAVIDTGFATRCNNDHGVSPDGTRLVISDQSQGDRKSRIYTLPVAGGPPTLVTPAGPSYWHGWSPDGQTLAYCAERNGEFDIYTIPVGGGPETRLTTAKGLDDGPEYSPDGRHLYFNSDRTGRMQVWRMAADGRDQTPVTDDEFNNWFPHPSPDGKALVFVSFEKDVVGHPADKDVTLRRLTLADGKIDVLGRFLGGQGTANVPCWSPDGRRDRLRDVPPRAVNGGLPRGADRGVIRTGGPAGSRPTAIPEDGRRRASSPNITKKPLVSQGLSCRADRIRTCDLLVPNQALYQTELQPARRVLR